MLLEKKLKKYYHKLILINSIFFYYPISVESQDWNNREILIANNNSMLQKVTIIMPVEWVSQLSIPQTIEDGKSSISNFEKKQFSKVNVAEIWLFSD